METSVLVFVLAFLGVNAQAVEPVPAAVSAAAAGYPQSTVEAETGETPMAAPSSSADAEAEESIHTEVERPAQVSSEKPLDARVDDTSKATMGEGAPDAAAPESDAEPTHQIGVALGGVHYQTRDDIVAPLRWSGPGFVVDLSYSRVGEHGRHDVEFRVPFALIGNRYNHAGLSFELNLAYDYLHKVWANESLGQVHLGGMLDWSLNDQLYESWDDSHLHWINAYEIGPAARWSRTVGQGQRLAVGLSVPLIALVSRPPKRRFVDQDRLPAELVSMPHRKMRLTSLHEHIAFRMGGEYTYQVNDRIALGASYLVSYRTFSKPERVQILTNILLLRFLFTPGNAIEEEGQ